MHVCAYHGRSVHETSYKTWRMQVCSLCCHGDVRYAVSDLHTTFVHSPLWCKFIQKRTKIKVSPNSQYSLKWGPSFQSRVHSFAVAKPSVGKLITAAGRTGYPNVKDRSTESHRGQYAKPNFLIFKSDKICISPQLNLLQKWCVTPFRQFWFLDNVNLTKTSVIGTKVILKFCQISYGLNNGTLSLNNNTTLTL